MNEFKSGKRQGEKYISSGRIDLSEEDRTKLIGWMDDGSSFVVRLYRNNYKEHAKHPDHNIVLQLWKPREENRDG